jgi:soluble lytic murein transglycosylase-like protein
MIPKSPRLPVVGIATCSFLVTFLWSSPTVPSVPDGTDRAALASASPLTSLLTRFTAGSRGLRALSRHDLQAALDAEPSSLGLFEAGPQGPDHRRTYLSGFPFGDAIFTTAERYRLDCLLLAAVVEAESGFASGAVSPQGAVGLMQVMPATGSRLGAADLADPVTNLDVGSRYFNDLLALYEGDVELALAAYNAGPATVDRYGGVPPFGETRDFVHKVLSLYAKNHRRVQRASAAADPQVLAR